MAYIESTEMAGDLMNPEVLIIDDDDSLQNMIHLVLERASIAARHAHSAAEAWQQLERKVPDVILLDLMMPQIHGLDFLKELRSREEYNTVPVIILSAFADKETIQRGMDAGASQYLTKPSLSRQLVAAIQSAIGDDES